MPADILEFCDGLAAKLQVEFDSAGVDATCTRDYRADFDLETLEGLHARVMPVGYLKDSPADRCEDFFDAAAVIVVAERYTGDEGSPPREWLDDRISIVERCVFDPLRRIGTDSAIPLLMGDYWNMWADVTTAFDADVLREKQVFTSEIETIFRKLRPSLV